MGTALAYWLCTLQNQASSTPSSLPMTSPLTEKTEAIRKELPPSPPRCPQVNQQPTPSAPTLPAFPLGRMRWPPLLPPSRSYPTSSRPAFLQPDPPLSIIIICVISAGSSPATCSRSSHLIDPPTCLPPATVSQLPFALPMTHLLSLFPHLPFSPITRSPHSSEAALSRITESGRSNSQLFFILIVL